MHYIKTSIPRLLSKVRNVEGWLSDHEALFLYHAARMVQAPGEIVEIGSWKGKSTVCLASGLSASGKSAFVWAVDPHEGILVAGKKKGVSTLSIFNRNIRGAGLTRFVKPVVSTSQRAVRHWSKPISFLFIDGLHDYIHTKQDYLLWKKYVVSGGVIAFHDGFCGIPGVWKAIDEQFFQSNLVDIGTVSSVLYGITGIPNIFEKMRVKSKITFIRFAQHIHALSWTPWWVKRLFIHTFIRMLLVTPYTIAVYMNK